MRLSHSCPCALDQAHREDDDTDPDHGDNPEPRMEPHLQAQCGFLVVGHARAQAQLGQGDDDVDEQATAPAEFMMNENTRSGET